MRRATRRFWVVLLFLSTTLVFWGLLQSQAELEEHALPSERHLADSLRRGTMEQPTNAHAEPVDDVPFRHVPGGTSLRLKAPKSNRLWPSVSNEREDRILPQINLIPGNPNYNDPSEEKLILVNNGYPSGMPDGRAKFEIDGCPVRNCRLTDDRAARKKAHAILFDGGLYQEPYHDRNPDQIWILFLLESPENVADLSGHDGIYNWTATYRLDSTMNAPYERFIPYANVSGTLPAPQRNYAKGKTKMVAWFVSNCYTTNKRSAYARELQRYIGVDIFGSCGNMTCFRSAKDKCNQMLNDNYKFYLAFENSNCRDYITEKFYWNALYNDIVPVVMGARPEDYAAVAPPGSYIHVDDFDSPLHLADYLNKLDKNDTLYNEYFRWKGTGEFINTKYWCRLCSMVHKTYGGGTDSMWYGNISKWWHGPGVCIRPGADEQWASWRTKNQTDSTSDADILFYRPRSTVNNSSVHL